MTTTIFKEVKNFKYEPNKSFLNKDSITLPLLNSLSII